MHSSNRRCHPSSCFFAVLAVACSRSTISSPQNVSNVLPFTLKVMPKGGDTAEVSKGGFPLSHNFTCLR